MQKSDNPTPWFRQLWPWLLIAPIAITMALYVYMFSTSVFKKTSVVSDHYYKEGLGINAVLHDIKAARALDLVATISIEGSQLVVDLTANQALPVMPIYADFSHAVEGEFDQSVKLVSMGNNRFVAALPDLFSGKWHIDIYNETQRPWRIKGQVFYPFKSIEISAKEP